MTGRYWDDSETMAQRRARAFIVDKFGPDGVDWMDYLRRQSRADDGRDP